MQPRVFVLGSLVSLLPVAAAHAQCAEPNFGVAISAGYQDDTVLPMQSLGFAFPFNGTTYTDVHVSTNGLIYLSNGGVPAAGGAGCCAGVAATLVSGSPIIAPFWSDHISDNAVGSEVLFNALPGRAVITWDDVREYNISQQYTFQVQLWQTGEIYFTYDSRCQIGTAGDLLVGVSEGGGAAVPAASDFLVPGVSPTTTCFETFTTLGSFDLGGQSLLLVPTGPTGYAWVATPCPKGSNVPYGTGCYRGGDSFYQLTVDPVVSAAALSNTAITMVPAGSEYVVITGGAYVPPGGGAVALLLTDDSSVAAPTLTNAFPYPGGTTTQFTVCSNGSVWVAGGNSIGYAPDVNVMLNTNTVTGYYAWHDYNPGATGSGQVMFEEVGNMVYVTWDNVYSFSGTSAAAANQLQFQFDTASGTVVIAFGTVNPYLHTSFTTGQPHLVGYSPGTPSTDIGSLNFATDLPFTTSPIAYLPMSLSAAPGPAVGSTVTWTANNLFEYVPTSGVYLSTLFLSVNPLPGGFDLGLIGAPGCNAYIVTLDVDLGGQVTFAPTVSWNLAMPAPTFAAGNVIAAQAIGLVAPNSLPNGQNAFGMVVSNAVLTTIGAW